MQSPASDVFPFDLIDTDRLVALSATFRDVPTPARESLADSFASLRGPFEERVVLHTCHRTELLGVLNPDANLPDIPGTRVNIGPAAAERAFLVAGGLDSVVIAEEQVLAQVKESYGQALADGETGAVLNELLRRAIRFGKRVRSEIQPSSDRSLADRAVRWVVERLGPEARPAAAMVLGSGAMGRLVAGLLATHGMTVTVGSRSIQRAESIVEELPNPGRHRSLQLHEALSQAGKHDVIAIAVRNAPTPLDRSHLEGSRPLPLVVDLSAPRVVSATAGQLLGDRLLDLDRLGSIAATRPLSRKAEARLRAVAHDGAADFIAWWPTLANGDAIALLRAHAAEIRERHLERLRRRPDLTADQLAVMEAAAAAMISELLHVPTMTLQHEPAARGLVTRLFGIGQ